MTRGKIILIQGDMKVYITCEFNGDMHPNMHGEEVLECFKNGVFQNYRGYERFVGNFNRKHFRYDEELIRESIGCGKRTIDVTKNWTDYLYIINDFRNAAALQISHESTVVFLLKKILHDKYDYIEYFIYELDYGRKYEVGMITDENGQDIDIHTSDLLYDFISNNGVICQKEV